MINNIQNLISSGKYDKAVSLIKKKLKKNKGDTVLLNILGCVYANAGDQVSAQNIFKKIITINPNADEAYFNLGLSYKAANNNTDAIRCYKKAIELSPSSSYYNNLGNALINNHEYNDAIIAFNKSLEIDKNSAITYYNLGIAYSRCGLIYKSIKAYNCSLEISETNQAKNNLANSYLATGEIDKAKLLYDDILTNDPSYQDAIAGKLKAFDLEKDYSAALDLAEPHINKLLHTGIATAFARIAHNIDKTELAIEWLNNIVTSRPSPEDTSACFFALGNIYDKLSDYKSAYNYYRDANALIPDTFNRSFYHSRVNNLITVFNRNTIDELAGNLSISTSSIKPVFIVGMPRSGTSLLEQMLSNHNSISAAGELDNFNQLNDKLFLGCITQQDYEHVIKNIDNRELENFRRNYLNILTQYAQNSILVTDKMPNNFLNIALISAIFPDSYIIHIKRNAIDTCLSCYFQNFSGNLPYASDLDNLCFFYKHYEKLIDHWNDILPENIINISYEELINDSEKQLNHIFDKLNLDWDTGCLEFYKNKRITVTSSYDQVRQPIYSSSCNRWMNYKDYIEPLIKCLS